MPVSSPNWIGLLTIVLVGVVLLLRLRGLRRARRLRLETLWVVPAVMVAALAFMIAEYPPRDALTWLWLALALAAGAGVGWWRGGTVALRIDPATHTLNQQASPAALLFVVLLIVARQGLRYEAASFGLNIFQVTGILTAFAVGLLAATRAELALRGRRLLADAQAGSSTGPTSAR